MSVLSSTPGTNVKPGWRAAAARASASPSVESWSVRAKMRTPLRAARSTSCVGVSRPSEAVLWLWKSALDGIERCLPVDPLDRLGDAGLVVDVNEDAVQYDSPGRLFHRQSGRELGEEEAVDGADFEADDGVAGAGHARVGHVGGAARQEALVGGGHVRVGANNGGHA